MYCLIKSVHCSSNDCAQVTIGPFYTINEAIEFRAAADLYMDISPIISTENKADDNTFNYYIIHNTHTDFSIQSDNCCRSIVGPYDYTQAHNEYYYDNFAPTNHRQIKFMINPCNYITTKPADIHI